MDYTKLLHRGGKFAARGADLFLKDVMHDGVWIHPLTNQTIIVTPEIRKSVEMNMAKYLAAGNKVPMPDGHTSATEANKGFWPGPFVMMGEDVLAIAQPTDAKAKQQMIDGSADAVSVAWWSKYKDPNGTEYSDIFEHVCLTNYPVLTKQRNFIKLSGKAADDQSPLLKLDLDLGVSTLLSIAAPEEDEELLKGLEKVYDAVKKGASKSDLNDMSRTPAQRLAALMSTCPVKS